MTTEISHQDKEPSKGIADSAFNTEMFKNALKMLNFKELDNLFLEVHGGGVLSDESKMLAQQLRKTMLDNEHDKQNKTPKLSMGSPSLQDVAVSAPKQEHPTNTDEQQTTMHSNESESTATDQPVANNTIETSSVNLDETLERPGSMMEELIHSLKGTMMKDTQDLERQLREAQSCLEKTKSDLQDKATANSALEAELKSLRRKEQLWEDEKGKIQADLIGSKTDCENNKRQYFDNLKQIKAVLNCNEHIAFSNLLEMVKTLQATNHNNELLKEESDHKLQKQQKYVTGVEAFLDPLSKGTGGDIETRLKRKVEAEIQNSSKQLEQKISKMKLYNTNFGEILVESGFQTDLVEKTLLALGFKRFFSSDDYELTQLCRDIKGLEGSIQSIPSYGSEIKEIDATVLVTSTDVATIKEKLDGLLSSFATLSANAQSSEELSSLKVKLANKEKDLEVLKTEMTKVKNSSKENENKHNLDMQNVHTELINKSEQIESLKKELEMVVGNTSRAYDDKSFADSEIYDSLKLDNVKHLSLVECHNLIKFFLYTLRAPLEQVEHRIMLYVLYSVVERPLLLRFIHIQHIFVYNMGFDVEKMTEQLFANFSKVKDITKTVHPLEEFLKELTVDLDRKFKNLYQSR